MLHTQRRKAVLAAARIKGFDALYALTCAAVILLVVCDEAYAYVDPSVVTYAIQAMAGAAVALSAVVGVAFRKTRKKLFKILGIDPDANKELDPPFQRFDVENPEAVKLSAEEIGASPVTTKKKNQLRTTTRNEQFTPSGPVRFAVAFTIAFMAIGTLLIVAPMEVVAGSQSDFVFTPIDIAPPLVITTLIVAAVLAFVISLFRGNAFFIAIGLTFAIGLCFYLQAMFLDTGLPIADGETVTWERYDKIAIATGILWLVIMAVSCVAACRWSKIAGRAFVVLAAALMIVQGVGVGSLVMKTPMQGEGSGIAERLAPTKEGLFELADHNNVIVFVLDTYDTAFFQEALKQQPDLADELTGFTWFTNPTGSLIPTRYGVPFLITGEMPHYDEKWSHFLEQRYARSSFLSDLHEAGYSVNVYSNQLRIDTTSDSIATEYMLDKVDNIADTHDLAVMDTQGMLKAALQIAMYRDLPWILKPRWWFETQDVSTTMLDETAQQEDDKAIYTLDDPKYFAELKERGLTIHARSEVGEYRLIHMRGSHKQFSMDENGDFVGKGKSDVIRQSIGSMRIVEYYIQRMKDLGVYDDATIIITADHGTFEHGLKTKTIYYMEKPSSPFIIAKLPGTHEEMQEPMKRSDAPVQHGDILPTIMKAIGLDSTPYNYKSLFDYTGEEDPNAPRYYVTLFMDGASDNVASEYAIEGNVLDLDNWHKTGHSWNCEE